MDEKEYCKRARQLLKEFRKLLDEKHRMEDEMKKAPMYTREDALYLLSGMAAHKEGERVQTSNIANAPEKAAMNADDLLERMNREALAEASARYTEVCEMVTAFNVGLTLMRQQVRDVVRQVYVRGKPPERVFNLDGKVMSRSRVFELIDEAVDVIAEVLRARTEDMIEDGGSG